MDFETWLLLGIFGSLLAISFRLNGIYKILSKKNKKNENISSDRH